MSTNTLRLSTPKGVAVYPSLKRPDKKFDSKGIYKADVRMPAAEAEPLIDQLSKIYKDHMGKDVDHSDNPLFIVDKLKDGTPTGTVTFKLRVKNVMRKDGEMWDRRPTLFDADLKPCDVDPKGGSVLRVSFDVWTYDKPQKGVKLQPVAVQVIELQEKTEDPASYGFEAEEGGFSKDSVEDLSQSFEQEDADTDDADY